MQMPDRAPKWWIFAARTFLQSSTEVSYSPLRYATVANRFRASGQSSCSSASSRAAADASTHCEASPSEMSRSTASSSALFSALAQRTRGSRGRRWRL